MWCGGQIMYNVTILRKTLQFPSTTPQAYRDLGEACLSPDPDQRPTLDDIVKTLENLPIT